MGNFRYELVSWKNVPLKGLLRNLVYKLLLIRPVFWGKFFNTLLYSTVLTEGIILPYCLLTFSTCVNFCIKCVFVQKINKQIVFEESHQIKSTMYNQLNLNLWITSNEALKIKSISYRFLVSNLSGKWQTCYLFISKCISL